uniref:Uncharacterized protein n=1 Tax=Glossina palpalis gambiensis TaxID=67801 RepID=A0A1B0B7U8_9MUSC
MQPYIWGVLLQFLLMSSLVKVYNLIILLHRTIQLSSRFVPSLEAFRSRLPSIDSPSASQKCLPVTETLADDAHKIYEAFCIIQEFYFLSQHTARRNAFLVDNKFEAGPDGLPNGVLRNYAANISAPLSITYGYIPFSSKGSFRDSSNGDMFNDRDINE